MWWNPLRWRRDRWGTVLLDSCTTYVNWETNNSFECTARPNASRCHMDHACNCSAVLASVDDPLKVDKFNRCHPSQFLQTSDQMLTQLLASPFWFARKFADGSIRS